MKFLCICAIYNHAQHWTENLVQCFLDQTYRNATLVLIDDRPYEMSLAPLGGIPSYLLKQNVHYLHEPTRFPTLMAKYDAVAEEYWDWDAVCVMDDDDVYLPKFLENHVKAMESDPTSWCYPDSVYTTFGSAVRREESGGRFWASAAYGKELYKTVGGFGSSPRADFDRDMLVRAEGVVHPRRSAPQYIYNWDITQDNHVSGTMAGVADTEWYGKSGISRAKAGFTPGYNDSTLWTLSELRKQFPEAFDAE